MQYLLTLRVILVVGVAVGAFVSKDSEFVAWLDGVATLKDVGEAVTWAVGRNRVREWEDRAGRRVWILRLVLLLGMLVVAYFGRGTVVMEGLSHLASCKDAAEAVSRTAGSGRLEWWGYLLVKKAKYRYVHPRSWVDWLLRRLRMPFSVVQVKEVSSCSCLTVNEGNDMNGTYA